VQEQAAARALLLSEPPVAAARPRALQATAAAQRAAGWPGPGCPLLQARLGRAFPQHLDRAAAEAPSTATTFCFQ